MPLRDINGQLSGRGPGRPKGARNRFTLLRQELLAAYHDLNPETGREHLISWARDNPTAFYTLIARLIPKESRASRTGDDWADKSTNELIEMIVQSSED